MAIRSISLVDRLELEIQGCVFQNAIAFGDVDSDGKNELVVGLSNGWGHLAIFKGKSSKPWRTSSGMGSVTVVLVGDVQNLQRNVILCINTEGWCHIFDLEFLKIKSKTEELEKGTENEKLEKVIFSTESLWTMSIPTFVTQNGQWPFLFQPPPPPSSKRPFRSGKIFQNFEGQVFEVESNY